MKIKRKRYKNLIKKYKGFLEESAKSLDIVRDEITNYEPKYGEKENLYFREARLKAHVIILDLVIRDLEELEENNGKNKK